MPLFGIINDSPLIFLGQKIARANRIGGAPARGLAGLAQFPSPLGKRGRISFGRVKIIFRKAEVDRLLNSPTGEVGRHLSARGSLIVAAAKAQVGVQTGKLKASISMKHSRNAFGQQIKIGSPVKYALAHHEGTRPHVITPNRREFLRFSSRGRIVYARAVMHPGTKPNKYLTDNLYLIR